MAHFRFDEATHVYAIGSRHVPSVTQVLDAAGMSPDLSHLADWYKGRGAAIHRAMALHLHGTLDDASLDDRIRPFVDNGRAWLDAVEAEPIVVEHRWVHTEHEYGGTLDLFCDSKLGPLLIDWKSTFHDPAYALQVAGGYEPLLLDAAVAGAVNADPEQVTEARIAVVTLKQACGKAHWCARHMNGVAQRHTFQAALDVVRWRQQYGR